MNCKHDKGTKMFAELDTEKGVGLIERVRQGQGKPAIIYVRKFFDTTDVLTTEKPQSALLKNRSQDFGKTAPNKNDSSYNDFNNTDSNDTDSIPFPSLREREAGTDRIGTGAKKTARLKYTRKSYGTTSSMAF